MLDGSKGPTRVRRWEGLGMLFQLGLKEVMVGKDLNTGQWGSGSWMVWSLEQGHPTEGVAGQRLEEQQRAVGLEGSGLAEQGAES